MLGTLACEEAGGNNQLGTGIGPTGAGDAAIGPVPGTGTSTGILAEAGMVREAGDSGPVLPNAGGEAGAPDAATVGDAGVSGMGRDGGNANVGDASSADASAAPTVCTGGQVPVSGRCVAPKVPNTLASGWVKIDPGPPTMCVTGAPYSFYVRKGTVNKVIVFLQGGGACWDDVTCLLPIYADSISAPGSSGILDPNNQANPFKDWYVVFAPYCSADTFLGDATQDYGSGPLQFKGAVNMKAVRDWVTTNITAPDFFFMSGCSAGAVGVPLHGAHLVNAYKDNPNVDGAMVTDSFQAIIPDGFAGIKNWNIPANFPDWLPMLKSLKEPYPGDIMRRGVKEALALPEFSRFVAANFNFAEDGVQELFYGFMGGDSGQIGKLIADATHDLAASRPSNYRFYTAEGSSHCVFESDDVYNMTTSGVRLIDWLGNVAKSADVKSVEPTP